MAKKHQHGITPFQKTLLDWVRDYIELREYSPTVREMAEGLGRHLSQINRALIELEQRNRISRLPGHSRSITLID